MSKIKSDSTITITVDLTLTEVEARALLGITMYGAKPFLEMFYERMGVQYLRDHEEGVGSLFETIKRELPQHIQKADEARKIFKSN